MIDERWRRPASGAHVRRPRLAARALWAAVAAYRALPLLVKTGFALVVAGLAIDLVYHATEGVHDPLHAEGLGLVGHLVTLAGMVVTMLAVFQAGWRNRRRDDRPVERRG